MTAPMLLENPRPKAETEEAYFEAYQCPYGTPVAGSPSKGERVAFIVHASNLLAHVQMMMGVLRKQDLVVVLAGDASGFRNLLPCTAISLPELPLVERFEALRDRLKENKVGTLIWVSVPLHARYAFGLRLAEKQVFWAMRFHPVAPGDLNITAGNRGEKHRMFHGKQWACVHAPFNVTINPVNLIECEKMRSPYEYVYGTLAREEKLLPEYLETVCTILKQHPESGFVWTGRKERPDIRQFFRERGLSNRQWFAGWVDADLYVNTLDCFLETFPLGGLTTFTAMGHGIPVVSMKNEHSPIGSLDTHTGLLAASGCEEYAEMALSLKDRQTRARVIEAGHKVFKAEQAAAEQDRKHFWRTVLG